MQRDNNPFGTLATLSGNSWTAGYYKLDALAQQGFPNVHRLPFTVIGIAPLDFSGRVRGPGLWIPLGMQGRVTGNPDIFHSENRPTLWLEGRLAPGRTRRELASEANVIAAQFPTDARDQKTEAVQRVLYVDTCVQARHR